MKNLKLYALFIALGLFTSCEKDEEPTRNTGDATISFEEKPTVSILETAGVYRIPLTVKGNLNGLAQVEAKITDMTSGDGYTTKEDVDYFITDNKIRFSDKNVYFEIKVVHDFKIVGNRKLKVELSGADGVTIGGQNSCEVIIEEVDDQLYYRMLNGHWIMKSADATADGQEVTGTVTFSNGSTSSEQILNANEKFLCTGFFDKTIVDESGLVWTLKFDEKDLKATLVRSKALGDLNFGPELGICTAYVDALDNSGKPMPSIEGEITVDADNNPISISFGGMFGVIIYSEADAAGGEALLYAAYSGLEMTFVPNVNK